MDTAGALDEAVVFLESFRDVADPRQQGKVVYPLDEILLLSLVAVLAGADGFADIARFGKKKLDFLRRLRPFAKGTPSHDQLGDVFAMLDPEAFRRCFVAWTSKLVSTPPEVIVLDGKTSRRSYSRKEEADPLHMLSAFAAGQRMVLGQMAVDGKSNEITAIPKLLEMLSIEGAVVTIACVPWRGVGAVGNRPAGATATSLVEAGRLPTAGGHRTRILRGCGCDTATKGALHDDRRQTGVIRAD